MGDVNCSEDCLAEEDAETSEGAKRVERSEFKEAIAEDAETETAMGTKRDERVCSVLVGKRKCLVTEISLFGMKQQKKRKKEKYLKQTKRRNKRTQSPISYFHLLSDSHSLSQSLISFSFPFIKS